MNRNEGMKDMSELLTTTMKFLIILYNLSTLSNLYSLLKDVVSLYRNRCEGMNDRSEFLTTTKFLIILYNLKYVRSYAKYYVKRCRSFVYMLNRS